MRPVSTGKKRCSVFLGITLAALGPLCGLTLRAQAPNPVPLVNQPLVPDATAPGGPQFTLTVNGTGFVSNSTVNWNGSPLATTFVSTSQLTAVVPAADIATASTGWVTVVNPAPGGGTSNVCFFSATTNTGNSVAFTPASSPVTGSYPSSVAAGDFNRDGKLDLAVGNCVLDNGCYSGAVYILLGDGTGNFTVASSPAVGGYPDAIATGDFNGDGKLDLAVANGSSNTVSILLGDGTGNFTLASSPATGVYPISVALGDFNGDGNLDLAVANWTDGTVSILLGDGTGNFTLTSSLATGSETHSVAAGDFNGDGKLDLAVASSDSNTISIFLGDGTGNFTLASSPATPYGSHSVAVGDFNGDGNLDLAAANWNDGTVSILLGDGMGNFTLTSTTPACASAQTIEVGDFNGDGKLDVAVTDVYGNTAPILLGDGEGNLTLVSSPVTGFFPNGLAVGDFNGDGKLDLAVPYSAYPALVSILLQAGPAVTVSPSSLSFGTQLFGTTSNPQTVTLTNTGGETLEINGVVASANFAQTNTCGSSLMAGANCTINVSFEPRGLGTLAGTITITDNASNSPQTVSLTGVGTEVTLSPAGLNFYTQTIGTTSAPQTVTLTNSGYRALTIAGLHFTGADPGDFAETNTCGTSVAAGASCTISVTFTPQAKGSRRAILGVGDNGGGAPQTVALKGYGT